MNKEFLKKNINMVSIVLMISGLVLFFIRIVFIRNFLITILGLAAFIGGALLNIESKVGMKKFIDMAANYSKDKTKEITTGIKEELKNDGDNKMSK